MDWNKYVMTIISVEWIKAIPIKCFVSHRPPTSKGLDSRSEKKNQLELKKIFQSNHNSFKLKTFFSLICKNIWVGFCFIKIVFCIKVGRSGVGKRNNLWGWLQLLSPYNDVTGLLSNPLNEFNCFIPPCSVKCSSYRCRRVAFARSYGGSVTTHPHPPPPLHTHTNTCVHTPPTR